MVLSENENIQKEEVEKWFFNEIKKNLFILVRFTNSNELNRVEIHDFINNASKLFELGALSYNKVLDRYVEMEITLGAMVDSIRSHLREEGAYNHKTIETALTFIRNLDSFEPDIEFYDRKELVEYHFYLTGNQIPELY